MDPVEGQWSPEEDEMLINLILNHGSIWSLISNSIPGKSVETCLSRLFSLLGKDGLMDQTDGRWSPEEDEMLINLILEHGFRLSVIGNSIPGKSVETYLSRLLSLLDKDGFMDQTAGRWSPEEDEMLLNLFEKHGSNWSPISKSIPGKSPAKCWSRWHSLAKNDIDQIERLWSSKEDEMLEYRVEKYQGAHDIYTPPPSFSNIGIGQWSSYINDGNLSHEVGGASGHPPPSISDIARVNMSLGGTHSYTYVESAPSISDMVRVNMSLGGTHAYTYVESAPSWIDLSKRDSSTMMIDSDNVQDFVAGDEVGWNDFSEVLSKSLVQKDGDK